jgi:hypothetical protein
MYTYDPLNRHFDWESAVNRENRGLTMHLRDIQYCKDQGRSSWTNPLRLDAIRWGRLILIITGQESQSYSSEVIRLESTKIRWFSWWPGVRLDRLPGSCSRAVFSQAKAKGNYQARVNSDQVILMIVRQKAGPVARWPKMLKWELENNSRQPRDLTKKRQSGSLK